MKKDNSFDRLRALNLLLASNNTTRVFKASQVLTVKNDVNMLYHEGKIGIVFNSLCKEIYIDPQSTIRWLLKNNPECISIYNDKDTFPQIKYYIELKNLRKVVQLIKDNFTNYQKSTISEYFKLEDTFSKLSTDIYYNLNFIPKQNLKKLYENKISKYNLQYATKLDYIQLIENHLEVEVKNHSLNLTIKDLQDENTKLRLKVKDLQDEINKVLTNNKAVLKKIKK